MRRTYLIVIGLVVALAVGGLACSDDDKPDKDASTDTIKFDLGQVNDLDEDSVVLPDGPVPDAAEDNMGEGCTGKGDCKAGSPLCISVLGSSLMICSRKCTPDDSNTPLINEDDCPDGYLCGAFRFTNNQTYNYCLKKCTPSLTKNPCPASAKTTCDPVSTRYGDLAQAVCYEPACQTDKDCPVLSAKSCNADGDCTSVGTDAFCDSTNKMCARPGKCTPGGLCGKHTLGKATAKVGDPCTSDFDCPGVGRCWQASTSSSSIGTHYNNGYCIIAGCAFGTDLPDFACPTGSSCFQMFYGGYCHKSCALANASECRGHSADKGGDYDCYAWNALSFGGVAASKTPICTSAASQTCDFFSGSSLDCTSIGEKGNPTNMSCRDRFTGVKKSKADDPTGVCLDDTASGTFQTPSDAGVPDSSPTVDAGVPDSAPATDATTTVDTSPTVDSTPTVDTTPTVDAAMTH